AIFTEVPQFIYVSPWGLRRIESSSGQASPADRPGNRSLPPKSGVTVGSLPGYGCFWTTSP
ncbi:MAG TPA: hypothetical protein PL064_00975, partial [Thermogutta sp.]|nr:hypothetical protein [Thermogutta sp.]